VDTNPRRWLVRTPTRGRDSGAPTRWCTCDRGAVVPPVAPRTPAADGSAGAADRSRLAALTAAVSAPAAAAPANSAPAGSAIGSPARTNGIGARQDDPALRAALEALVDAGASGGIPGYVSVAYNDRAGTRSAIVLLPTQPDQAIAARYDEAVATAVCRIRPQRRCPPCYQPDPPGRGTGAHVAELMPARLPPMAETWPRTGRPRTPLHSVDLRGAGGGRRSSRRGERELAGVVAVDAPAAFVDGAVVPTT
jgi:hypothetical protein